jgi:DNA-binding ferritin-like protein
MSSPVVHIEKIEYHTHNHIDVTELNHKIDHVIRDVHEVWDIVKELQDDPDGDLKTQILNKLDKAIEDIKKTV